MKAVVRVTHASVGATDVLAARGEYLLHPFPGVVTGYDLIGTVTSPGPLEGRRVAAILPRMGAHTDHVTVNPALLVPVPDALDDAVAATLPLDGVTAHAALDALRANASSVLIQGITGAVGRLAAQLAEQRGLTVYGTASNTPGAFDYRDPAWLDNLRDQTGGVDGAIDHTGNTAIRTAVRPTSRIVRTAFGGGRLATATGGLRATTRYFARPAERVCSVPLLVATRTAHYRHLLKTILDLAATGTLTPPTPVTIPDLTKALDTTSKTTPGTKVILTHPTR